LDDDFFSKGISLRQRSVEPEVYGFTLSCAEAMQIKLDKLRIFMADDGAVEFIPVHKTEHSRCPIQSANETPSIGVGGRRGNYFFENNRVACSISRSSLQYWQLGSEQYGIPRGCGLLFPCC
jgi:hypothetical protein